jgi:deoxyribodipyrimidine photo-lyase
MQMPQKWGIHWFRRDLRIPANQALEENRKRTGGRTLGLFCFDSAFLTREDFSHNRFGFFLATLAALRDDWRRSGGDLLVVDCQPQEAFTRLLYWCSKNNLPDPALVTWCRDYEPFALARDSAMESLLRNEGLEVIQARDHLLFEPQEICKDPPAGGFYQVFSPYGRRWFKAMHSPQGLERVRSQSVAEDYFRNGPGKKAFTLSWAELAGNNPQPFPDALDEMREKNRVRVNVPLPEAGFQAAYSRLRAFRKSLPDYQKSRDLPAESGTSRLSIYFKNGSLTVPQALNELQLEQTEWEAKGGEAQFCRELAWREFYYSILYHRPDVEKQSFLAQTRNLAWENNKAWFRRWQEGTTGFPVVDAGMRELATTGWMHNRVRMIVASFLTKDLLIDWRWGERHFMQWLLDGDLAANNGGWQWAASTGCDPQPYFRIFNPWLQGKKFDPDGAYIRRFVPELRSAPTVALHDPDADRSAFKYPAPLVVHAAQKEKAVRLFRR